MNVIDRLKLDFDSALNLSTHPNKHEETLVKKLEHINENHLLISKFIEQLNQQVVEQSPTILNNPPSTLQPVDPLLMDNKPLVEFILDQLKTLKSNTEKGMDALKSAKLNPDGQSNATNGQLPTDVQELQEQIIKLKSLLSTKREQIATLRTVLKVYYVHICCFVNNLFIL